MAQSNDEFKVDTSERLAQLETKQDVVVDRIEDLADGQDDIMEKLEETDDETDELAHEDQLEDIREKTTKNAKKLERYDAALKLGGTALALIASGSAYVMYFA